jgi:hypothetical protein
MRQFRWVGLLLLVGGCGAGVGASPGALPPSAITPVDSGAGRDGKRDAVVDVAHGDGAAAPGIDGGGPLADLQITMLAPTAGSILKAASSPEIRAQVTATLPLDAGPVGDHIATVAYAFIPAATPKAKPLVSGPLFGPAANSEFATRSDLTTLPTGDYILAVTAVTYNGGVAAATLAVQVDAGPTVRIISPKSGGTYKGSVAVQVQIDSAPFPPTVEPVQATVGGYPLALSASGNAGFYQGIIEFEKYQPPLVDEQRLTVIATNALGTSNQAEVKFVVDVHGPTFSDTLPVPGAVVGGVIVVRAKVTDVSGILGPSVIAIIEDQADSLSFRLELKPEIGAPGYYSALFDTAKFPRCKVASTELCVVFPNLSFRASDTLGNDAFLAYDFAVDHLPPLFDLDPPADLRLMKFDQELRMNVCSWAFDPLGNWSRPGDMPNQGSFVPQIFDLRARIEDDGNRGIDLKVVPISGIDPATTHMYVLDDTTQPLVVDWDGDGYCDGINPLLVPTASPPKNSNQVMTIRLVPVTPKGTGDFTPDPSLLDPLVLNSYPGCNQGVDEKAPLRLCGVENIPVAIGYPSALDPQAAVWTIEPLTEKEPWCLGSQFDTYANQIADGWACFAAGGADRNGNQGVSAPLRLYVSAKFVDPTQPSGQPKLGPTGYLPPTDAGAAPDCTGTYDPLTKQLSAKPCIGRRFPSKQVRWQGDTTAAGAK